jgi:hypothetical protein
MSGYFIFLISLFVWIKSKVTARLLPGAMGNSPFSTVTELPEPVNNQETIRK